jgi:hypothetical protein
MRKIFLAVFALVIGTLIVVAGTLDDAPFRVVLPSEDWKLNDSAAQAMGKDVYLVASITSTNAQLKSVIIKTEETSVTSSTLNELCDGIRDTFSNPAIKKLSDDETVFLGCKARRFTYLVNDTTYNIALVFVSGKNGWTIVSTGPLGQKPEIQKLITFFQKK